MPVGTLRVVLFAEAQPAWAGQGVRVELAAPGLALGEQDALVFAVPDRPAMRALLQRADLGQLAADAAVVVIAPSASLDDEIVLLQRGVQEVVPTQEPQAVRRALWHAVERRRLELGSRSAYATDPGTGLPHEAQLLEHASQLIALREREPAPMALIVLRVEGLSGTAHRLGHEAAQALRRKLAVRLRAGLRAGDVVAAIGPDAFAVLLGHVEAIGDGDIVAAKLVHALREPFQVGGHGCTVAVATGLARYPEHATDAHALLRRAVSQAASTVAMGREGFASYAERGPARAANDDNGAT